MRSQVCGMCHHAAIGMALIVLMSVSACDDVPTFQELTGDAVEGEVPEQFAVDQAAAAPPVAPQKRVETARTPQQVIDDFLATDTRIRTNAHLEQLTALNQDVLKQITALELQDSQVNDLGVKAIPLFPALEELNLTGTAVTNAGMQQVAEARGLRKVLLDRMIIDGAGLAALADHEQMREMSLSQTPISDSSFEHLRKMEGLEVLRVSGSRNLQGHGFDELVQNRVFNNLRELQAAGTGFGYYGLRNLKNLPALEILVVRDAQVSDQAMIGIAGCRNLRELDLSRNLIGNEGLKLLTRLNQLESLKLIDCNGITGEGLNSLKSMKSLTFLDLTGCRCTTADVETLKKKFLKNTEIHFNDEVY